MVAFRQNRQLAASSFYDRLNAGNGMKSELHPVCSTAACSLHLFPMNILSRAFALCCLIAASLVSIAPVSAQNLTRYYAPAAFPNDKRNTNRFLLRRRALHRRQRRRHGAPPDKRTWLHFIRAIFAGRNADRVHVTLRRQHGSLRNAGRRRHAEAPDDFGHARTRRCFGSHGPE